MDMVELERIEERVSSLERSGRRYRLLSVVLGLALGVVATMAALPGPEDVIRARRFEVVNDKGALLFVADGDANGGRVVVRGVSGKGGVNIFTNPQGGAIGLMNKDDRLLVRQGVSDKGGLIAVTNSSEKLVVLAAANDSTDGALIVYNRNGRPIWNAR